MEVHQEVLRGKEEEVARVMEEKDELQRQIGQLESKLEELKAKNNVSSSSDSFPV